MPQFKYKAIIKKIIGAAMEVHSVLDNGLQLNFGGISLEYKRLENPKYNPNLKSPESILIHSNPRSDK